MKHTVLSVLFAIAKLVKSKDRDLRGARAHIRVRHTCAHPTRCVLAITESATACGPCTIHRRDTCLLLQHGSPFKATDVDMDMMGKNTAYCYTQEEAEKRYGKDEGGEFGADVMVCGCKLPKKRAVKFMKLCGTSRATATHVCQFVMLHHTCKQPQSLVQAAIVQCHR